MKIGEFINIKKFNSLIDQEENDFEKYIITALVWKLTPRFHPNIPIYKMSLNDERFNIAAASFPGNL